MVPVSYPPPHSLRFAPQTAPAALVRDSWNHQLCSIDEGGPVSLPHTDVPSKLRPLPPINPIYKTLSDPSVLIRNLSFEE